MVMFNSYVKIPEAKLDQILYLILSQWTGQIFYLTSGREVSLKRCCDDSKE